MKKLTPNQKVYKQQVQRIKRAIKRLEKQGFYLNTDLSSIIGITPKRIFNNSNNSYYCFCFINVNKLLTNCLQFVHDLFTFI